MPAIKMFAGTARSHAEISYVLLPILQRRPKLKPDAPVACRLPSPWRGNGRDTVGTASVHPQGVRRWIPGSEAATLPQREQLARPDTPDYSFA